MLIFTHKENKKPKQFFKINNFCISIISDEAWRMLTNRIFFTRVTEEFLQVSERNYTLFSEASQILKIKTISLCFSRREWHNSLIISEAIN